MKCGICKNSNIETDAARDISYCTTCGLVIEESTIVSDVQFAQDSKGASVLQGQYVTAGDNRKLVGGRFVTTNHAATIRNIAKSIGDALGIGETQIGSALRWYNLSLQFNFTKGRKTQVLLAACLYITCREEETPHMLIDFATVLRVSVFKIGGVFLKLVRLLNITVPLVDPSLYVPRFCSKLQLNGPAVAKTSLRLIARMNRDWMVIGRKPAGICGAAILIASRIHKSERTIEEVAGAVRVCEATINKRLSELKETASASLTVHEFNTIWLEKEEDPPVIKMRHKIEKQILKEKREKGLDDSDALRSPSSMSTFRIDDGSGIEGYDEGSDRASVGEDSHYNIDVKDINVDDVVGSGGGGGVSGSAGVSGKYGEVVDVYDKYDNDNNNSNSNKDNKKQHNDNEIDTNHNDTNHNDNNDDNNDESDLSGFNLDVDSDAILSEEEVKEKERMWDAMHGEYVMERKKREAKPKPKQKKPKQKALPLEDAVESAVKTKNLSSRINYTAIQSLFQK